MVDRVRRADAAAAAVLDHMERWRALAAQAARWAYAATDQQAVIDADVRRWSDVLDMEEGDRRLERLFYAFPEFRAVFYYRLQQGNAGGALAGRLIKGAWKAVPGLDLTASNAGPGLFISHGQGTVLSAERIGANCFVHHGVTVGWDYRGERLPVVGEGVFIGAGAKILGAVTIGDGARIGANAVVVCDVPPGATAVGAPARVVPAGGSRPPDRPTAAVEQTQV